MSTTTVAPRGSRTLGATEMGWYRAVPGGTGVTVLALLLKNEPDLHNLEDALQKLQSSHPILRAKIRPDPNPTSPASFLLDTSSNIRLRTFDPQSTAKILAGEPVPGPDDPSTHFSTFEKIVEHEMNNNPWASTTPTDGSDMFYPSAYEYEEGSSKKWVIVLKLHAAVCDRAAAVYMMRELTGLMLAGKMKDGKGTEVERKGDIYSAIEEYVPSEKSNKPFWARGMGMLGYSLNSLRLAHLGFVDAESMPRRSQVVRLQLERTETSGLLEGCKRRGIKTCGALGAAGLMAARLCEHHQESEWEKFAVVTLIDCRPMLKPPLTSHHIGFYHSAIINTHDVNGSERLWDLARQAYSSFFEAKRSNKHLTDMADLNYLMCKAIENPGLTPSSSSRTSFISVFEEPVVDATDDKYEQIGLEDYMGCASVHGVGPSIAVFETIRDGRLDCALVYPAPLHSRTQMQEFVDHMKRILVSAGRDS